MLMLNDDEHIFFKYLYSDILEVPHLVTLFLGKTKQNKKMVSQLTSQKIVYSANGTGVIGYLYAKCSPYPEFK